MVSLLSMVVNSWILGLLYWLCICCCWVQLAKLFFGIFLSKREGMLEGEGRGEEAQREHTTAPACFCVGVCFVFVLQMPFSSKKKVSLVNHLVNPVGHVLLHK